MVTTPPECFPPTGACGHAEGGNDDIHVTHITDGDEASSQLRGTQPETSQDAQRDLGIDFSKRVANKEDYRLIRIATPTPGDSLAVTISPRGAGWKGTALH